MILFLLRRFGVIQNLSFGYTFLFVVNKVTLRFKKSPLVSVSLLNGLYILHVSASTFDAHSLALLDADPSATSADSTTKRKREPINPSLQWHLRLGHIGVDRINRLVKDGPLNDL